MKLPSPPRLLLIYPPISVAERYGVDIGDIGGRQAPLGLLYLASCATAAGYEVEVLDAEAESISIAEALKRVQQFQPDFIGISVTTVAIANASKLATEIGLAFPDVHLFAGGAHISADPSGAIETSPFEVGIFGEGELTLLELLKSDFKQEKLASIEGIVWRKEDGSIVQNSPREYITNLDSLEYPARNKLSDIKLYRPPIGCYKEEFVVSIITSRGCPYRCIFCDNNTFGRNIRYFSPGYVIGEIETILNNYNAKEITFVDDTFPSNKKRFLRILEMILERDLKFAWTCMANLNDLDYETARMMKKAGCWQIAVGIESGDNAILAAIRKSLTVERIREKIELLHKAGILVKGFFMMGHPNETPETLAKTIELALSLPLTDVTCTIATPIKGTELYDMASSGQYGTFDSGASSSKFNYWEPVFTPTGLSAKVLYDAQRKFFRRFYMRPQIILRQFKKIDRIVIFKRYLQVLWKILKMRRK